MRPLLSVFGCSLLLVSACGRRGSDDPLAETFADAPVPAGWRWSAFVGDVDGDGYDDVAVLRGPTEVGIVLGRPDFEGTDLQVAVVFELDEGAQPREAQVEPAGDVDGDGFADLIVSTRDRAYLVRGDAGEAHLHSEEPSSRIVSITARGVRAAGDLDADGMDDLLVQFEEVLAIVRGRSVWTPINSDSLPGDGLVVSHATNAWFPVAAVGDVNGDGYDDLATLCDGGGVRLHSGDALPWTSLTTVNELVGDLGELAASDDVPSDYPSTGGRVVPAADVVRLGDVNGDGRDDFAAGTWVDIDRPIAFIVLGDDAPIRRGREGLAAGIGGFRIDGQLDTVTSPGDVDGDGRAEILTGAIGEDFGAWVIAPRTMPTQQTRVLLDLPDASVSSGAGMPLPQPSGARKYGWRASGGDFNGDGIADIVVGYLVPTSSVDWRQDGQLLVTQD